MSLDEKFNAAAEKVKSFTKRPSDDELLEIYGLFKQGSIGDNNTSRPGMLDFKGRAKWDAWTSRNGMTCDEAKQAYVDLVDNISQAYL